MTTPIFLCTGVSLSDIDFGDSNIHHSHAETKVLVTTVDKRMDQFGRSCFWMGTVLGVLHQLACLGFYFFVISIRCPVVLTSLRLVFVAVIAWSCATTMLLMLVTHHVQNIVLASGNKENLGKFLMVMERTSLIGIIVGAGVAWAMLDLILGSVTTFCVTVVSMAVSLAVWKSSCWICGTDEMVPDVVECEDGVFRIV
jgi:hypothetical protein